MFSIETSALCSADGKFNVFETMGVNGCLTDGAADEKKVCERKESDPFPQKEKKAERE